MGNSSVQCHAVIQTALVRIDFFRCSHMNSTFLVLAVKSSLRLRYLHRHLGHETSPIWASTFARNSSSIPLRNSYSLLQNSQVDYSPLTVGAAPFVELWHGTNLYALCTCRKSIGIGLIDHSDLFRLDFGWISPCAELLFLKWEGHCARGELSLIYWKRIVGRIAVSPIEIMLHMLLADGPTFACPPQCKVRVFG